VGNQYGWEESPPKFFDFNTDAPSVDLDTVYGFSFTRTPFTLGVSLDLKPILELIDTPPSQ